jgi:tetratricopeptide (TPR) repeat protein
VLAALVGLSVVALEPAQGTAHPGLEHQESALSQAIAASPADPELRRRRAAIRRERGDWRGALKDLAVASRSAGDDPRILLEEARARIDGGQRRRGEALLDRALGGALDPRDLAGAAELRAALREARGDLEGARADYDAAARAQPTVDRYLHRGRIDEARGELAAAIEGYREGVARLAGAVVLERALVRVLAAAGRHREALVRVDAMIARAPIAASWRLERAAILEARGDAGAAERARLVALAEIDGALARRPVALHRMTRARCLAALGRRDEALAEAEALARSDPKLPGIADLLAEVRGAPARPPAAFATRTRGEGR